MTRQTITNPRIARVEIEDRGDYLCVAPYWEADVPLDRPNTGGISVGQNRRLGERLKAAYLAGVATGPGEVRTDVNGKTYVQADNKVLGRTLNADLKRLGF